MSVRQPLVVVDYHVQVCEPKTAQIASSLR
jgi:hypothetical protein